MSDASFDDRTGRRGLQARLEQALRAVDPPPTTPCVVVDLDAFDANADDLVRRAAGTPIRVASKSLRVPALLSRALDHPGFAGILAYNLREAIWLVENDVTDDVLMGYPSVDRIALARLLSSARLSEAITLMVDSPAHLDLVSSVLPTGGSVRIALDIDAGLKVGPTRIGVKRSPLFSTESVVSMARDVLGRSGFELVGVMTYEGQVAGLADNVPDARVRSLAVRRVKSASVRQLGERRAAIAAALAQIVPLRLWNAGGSGSVETSAADPVVTEVAAGSGLLVPTLFDHYRSFHPRPAAFFGVPVVRRPSDTTATVAGGGLIASGATGTDRSPLPWAPPGLSLTKLEGAGEVQTPLDGPGATHLSIGDLVWFRHAKSGELMEHVTKAHLVSGASLVDVVATYRGTGNAW